MSRVQVINKDDKPAYYVVPTDLWPKVQAAIEEAEDIADLERFDRDDDGVRFPLEVAMAIADGERPVRAWREHRAMTQEQLADASGVSKPFVSQIEGGKRTGSASTLARFARALGCRWGL